MGEGAEVEHACERRWNMHARVGGQREPGVRWAARLGRGGHAHYFSCYNFATSLEVKQRTVRPKTRRDTFVFPPERPRF